MINDPPGRCLTGGIAHTGSAWNYFVTGLNFGLGHVTAHVHCLRINQIYSKRFALSRRGGDGSSAGIRVGPLQTSASCSAAEDTVHPPSWPRWSDRFFARRSTYARDVSPDAAKRHFPPSPRPPLQTSRNRMLANLLCRLFQLAAVVFRFPAYRRNSSPSNYPTRNLRIGSPAIRGLVFFLFEDS